MQWVEPPQAELKLPLPVEISLLEQAVAANPNNPALHEKLGTVLLQSGNATAAAEALEIAARRGPQDFSAWAALAACYLKLDLPEAALSACARGAARGPNGEIDYWRGLGLQKLGQSDRAHEAFLSAIRLSPNQIPALKSALTPLGKHPDGGQLLEFCGALPLAYKDTALVRAYRAIALSRLGRTDEAMQLVNLHQHVAHVSFTPPPQFGDIARFNQQLADEILADPAPESVERYGAEINHAASRYRSEAFLALRAFMKAAIDGYLDEASERGLAAIMSPPAKATLGGASVVLRGDTRNGQHVHGNGYVSVVYYVSIPDCIRDASDDRGALVLGCCDWYTEGYVPCWSTRSLKPEAGWLVIFPSHFFHDVVPSQTDIPRISIAADMMPIRTASI